LETTKRLLVVEDDPDNLALLKAILGAKYDVVACGSVADALMALDGFVPDLFVLDVGLRPVDGVEFFTAIRQVPGYENVPAMALTGYARETDKQRFLKAGFSDVVVKPILNQTVFEAKIALLVYGPRAQRRDPAAPENLGGNLMVQYYTIEQAS
jgi:two-component system, OmpR family, aerobic respiration control sensor histidine kinase ArcB